MSQANILLLEDDPNLGFILQENLELQGYRVERCTEGEAGLLAFLKQKFDLCLIDVMLPRKDGFSLARDIRKTSQELPIIFLTAKSLKEDRIEGFKIGGDDYITKPFSMEELALRIQAVLRRSKALPNEKAAASVFQIRSYTFNVEQQTLQHGEETQKLTAKEAELLRLLCLHLNEVLEREVALKLIWGEDNYFNARSMDVFISKLRKYLSADERIEIRNVHGKGFRLRVVEGELKSCGAA